MNSKIFMIIALVVFIVVCVGGWFWMYKSKVVVVETKVERESLSIVVDRGQVWLNSDGRPFSMIDLVIRGDTNREIISFVTNSEVFNSEMRNVIEEGGLKLTLAVMKSTDDLPRGKVLLGDIVTNGEGELNIESGEVTFVGQNGFMPTEEKFMVGLVGEVR